MRKSKTQRLVEKRRKRAERLEKWYAHPRFKKVFNIRTIGNLNIETEILKQSGSPSARLDAELIMMHATHKSREYIFAHPEKQLWDFQVRRLERLLRRRIAGEPMAYIIGRKEFYGRGFIVNKNVLIPRPETEDMIEIVKQICRPDQHARILDIGTGSGCIAVTLALELPSAKITAIDNSKKALKVARKNANTLAAKVFFKQSNLLENIEVSSANKYNTIVANLPYVDLSWQVSPGTKFEPETALFASDGGLELIKKLLVKAPSYLTTDGYVIIEADERQHRAIIDFASKYKHVETQGLVLLFKLKRSSK